MKGNVGYDKKRVCLSLDKDIVHKLTIIHAVKKRFFKENTTVSGIVNDALYEYFDRHAEEINELMEDHQKKGGCFKL